MWTGTVLNARQRGQALSWGAAALADNPGDNPGQALLWGATALAPPTAVSQRTIAGKKRWIDWEKGGGLPLAL